MTAQAPYNFIGICPQVAIRYESMEDLPAHDTLNPMLKSGRIFVELEADSPIFISDGNEKNPQFPKDSKGQSMIPASSLRGLIRSTAEILGCGLFRKEEHFKDTQIYFRDMATSSQGVSSEMKDYYTNALQVKTEKTKTGKPVSIPYAVQSGYLRCEGGKYYIAPTETPFLRVSRKLLASSGYQDLEANSQNVAYTHDGKEVKTIVPLSQKSGKMEEGLLLCTGKPVGKVPNSLYVFPLARKEEFLVSTKDVLSYQEDWETRQNVLGQNKEFWKLPSEGSTKPVFFLRHNDHDYFGMSLFIRIGHKFSLSQGLPKTHRELQEGQGLVIDYPYALFGFATKEEAYRSRVSFSSCTAQGTVKPMPVTSTILAGPKPSYFPGYVRDGKHYSTSNDKNSDQAGFQLRGNKQYWLKEADIPPAPADKTKVATMLKPLPKGTRFRGVVRFHNLHPDELGLLLWSLQLNPDCYHSLGMGKPFGLGRCSLKITKLEEDSLDCYQPNNLCQEPVDSVQKIQEYIDCYENYVAKHFSLGGNNKKNNKNKKPSQLSNIQDFFYLHATIQQENVSYMELNQYKNIRTPLPTINEYQEDLSKKTIAVEKTVTIDDLMAKFNSSP